MLTVSIDETHRTVILEPDGALSESDFRSAAAIIDPWIERSGRLRGLIVHSTSFPGWESFAALVSHLKFVKHHHRRVERAALVTDSPVANLVQRIGRHFITTNIRVFPYQDFAAAREWVAGPDE
jgi:hypothetical protein